MREGSREQKIWSIDQRYRRPVTGVGKTPSSSLSILRIPVALPHSVQTTRLKHSPELGGLRLKQAESLCRRTMVCITHKTHHILGNRSSRPTLNYATLALTDLTRPLESPVDALEAHRRGSDWLVFCYLEVQLPGRRFPGAVTRYSLFGATKLPSILASVTCCLSRREGWSRPKILMYGCPDRAVIITIILRTTRERAE